MADTTPKPRVYFAATVKNLDTNEFSIRVEFQTIEGDIRSVILPRAEIQSPRSIVQRLFNAGAELSPREAAQSMIEDALRVHPPTIEQQTGRTGWTDGSFVLPDLTIGDAAGILSFRPGNEAIEHKRGGTLKAFRRGLKEPCAKSSFLLFSMAAAYAGPLLEYLGEQEGAVFNLAGKSSTGKSLCCRAAQAVIKSSGVRDLKSSALSERGLEEVAFAHNDCLLVLDELGNLEGKLAHRQDTLRSWAYKLAGTTGKVRSKSVATELPTLSWRIIAFLSSEAMIADLGRRRDDGEIVRLIDIPVPDRSQFGVFDGATDASEAIALARMVEETICANYGRAFPAYLEALLPEIEKHRAKAREDVQRFVARACPDGDAWERRFAGKFAIIYAAGKLAARLRVAPWSTKQPMKAVSRVYRRALAALRQRDPSVVDVLKKFAAGG